MVDDPLAGPGGVGYSWFRLEVVSGYVGDTIGQATTFAAKTQSARSSILITNSAITNVFKTKQARARWMKMYEAFSEVTKLKVAMQWIKRIGDR